jgi:dynactin 4
LYGGLSVSALKKSRERPQPMRESHDSKEGLSTYSTADADAEDALIERLQGLAWEDTATSDQRLSAPNNHDARFIDQLWPVASQLRTRRGKRCKECRQFLARPDPKVSNLKYKIRLLALNHIPRLTLKPLHSAIAIQTANPLFPLRPSEAVQPDLQPLLVQQYILTVRNPIFETVKISLATPAITPGRVQSRVTILCPSFTLGPAGDVWDEALSTSTPSATKDAAGGPEAAMASLTGRTTEESERQPEAGKIWDRTRNSTSVIIEVIPGPINPPATSIVPKTDEELAREEEEEGVDPEIVEIPIYLRAEWESIVDAEASEKVAKGRSVGEKVPKELAYWCVLGVGRIAG